ncbi:MAG: hypothetical protein HN341_02600 [Verrucomicrobia bacterium]|jgi:hypothetical protein|nr:hypothetical protein [Verrucomicrobiota bacterium]
MKSPDENPVPSGSRATHLPGTGGGGKYAEVAERWLRGESKAHGVSPADSAQPIKSHRMASYRGAD